MMFLNITLSKFNAPDSPSTTNSNPIPAIVVQGTVGCPADIANFVIALPAGCRSSSVL
jgi:hypothetical protein